MRTSSQVTAVAVRLGTTALAAAGLLAGLTAPVAADTSGGTAVTFVVTPGPLSISTPPPENIGTDSPDSLIVGELDQVVVHDDRGDLDAAWTTVVSTTDFTTGGSTPAETIPAANVSYDPQVASYENGVATFTIGTPGALDVPRVAFSVSEADGNTEVAWYPKISVSVPPGASSGTYSGTITHSVS